MVKLELTRKIDALGRVVIPRELRARLGWDIGDTLSLCCENGTLAVSLLKKQPAPKCAYCKRPEREVRVNGKDICSRCLEKALEKIV